MKRWLIYRTSKGQIYHRETVRGVHQAETEQDAIRYISSVTSGEVNDIIHKVYEVDVQHGTMTELEVKLEGFKLVLVKKPSEGVSMAP